MKKISFTKNLFLSFLNILCIVGMSGIAYSGNIIVRPGKFDHFVIRLPEKIRAGEVSTVRLNAYDAHDNLITDFGETGKDFKISVSGSAQVQPSVLKAVSFVGGSAGITITDQKAETIMLSVFEVGGTVPVATRGITIFPNKLDHFSVQSPQSITAGNNFDIKITAKDAFYNLIADAEIESKNIKIMSLGTTNFKVISMSPAFRNGEGIATLMAEKVGSATVEVYDIGTGSKGISPVIKIIPAVLSHFKVYAPKEAIAGEPFEVNISALDVYDNLVDNYASYGNGVNITSTGQAKPAPSFIGQSEFRNGQAVVKLIYEKAEEISIIATENTKTQQGRSTAVKINPASPENFVVVTPDTAIAGQRFRIKIEAYDRFNNIVKNYNLVGNDVYLNVTGTGILSPKVVSASEFIDGIASLDVVYDKAESFTISASMATKREEKKIAIKEQKEEIKMPEAKIPEKPTIPKPEAVEKPLPPPPPVTTKEEKPPVTPVKRPEKKEIVKEEKPKEKFFEIKKVSLIEAKNKAMVIVNMKATNGNLEYKGERESLHGKDWIKINLRPTVNKAKKVWKFKSAFVKEIHIEEDKAAPGVVDIRIETLSKQFTFDVNRVKDSLVISIAGP